MFKKRIKKLEERISNIEINIRDLEETSVGKDYAKMHDYLVRTSYTGILKDKKLIKDYLNKTKELFKEDDFSYLCKEIQNYIFDYKKLRMFYFNLLFFEDKQIVLDTYKASEK